LQASHVSSFAHFSAKSIYFARNVAFCQPTNCWIARHLPDGVRVDRQKKRLTSHPSYSQRGLNTRVTGTNNNDIVLFWINEHE
jgi:hypothetical protein